MKGDPIVRLLLPTKAYCFNRIIHTLQIYPEYGKLCIVNDKLKEKIEDVTTRQIFVYINIYQLEYLHRVCLMSTIITRNKNKINKKDFLEFSLILL